MFRLRSLGPILVAAVAVGNAGCTAAPRNQLPGAVYAAHSVPVYRHVVYDDAMGGHYEDEDGRIVSESQSWFFHTKDPMDQVEAWYDKNFPNSTKKEDVDGDGRSVTYTFVPQGAEAGEEVRVTLRPGEVQIGEECKPGKIKKD